MKKSKIRKFLANFGLAGYIKLIFQNNALKELGWFKSYNSLNSIDKFGNTIPWCTYAFTAFIEKKLTKEFTIFEYGSGNSTLWFSNFVDNITSVEHDKDWYNFVSKNAKKNIKILYRDIENTKEEYINASKYNQYDIILIDGRYRVECIKASITALKTGGIIILDNSERARYKEGFRELELNGFRYIDFWGMSPGVAEWNCTTIFYKDENCLKI